MKYFILLLLVFTFDISVLAESETYKTASEYDYPPFAVVKDGKADGFSVELLKAVAEETGIHLEFKVDDWETIKNELKSGKLDVLPLVAKTPERDEYYDFTVPYIVMHGNIFVRSDSKTIHSESDLFGKEIIVMAGDSAHEYAVRRGFTEKLVLTKSYGEAFKLLSSGKHDAVLAQSVVGLKLIKELKLNNIKAVTKPGGNGLPKVKVNLSDFEQKFCFAVKEGDKELLEKLNEGLAIVSANGRYQKIYDKWFPFLADNESLRRTFIINTTIVIVPIIILLFVFSIYSIRREIKKKTEELNKKNEEKRETEDKYRLLAENTVECIWILNLTTGKYKYMSPSITKLRGLSVEEAINENPEASMTPESQRYMKELIEDGIRRLLNGESVERINEFQQYCKDGAIKDIEISTKLVLDQITKEIYAIGVSRDITEKNRLKRANNYNRNLIETSLDPLVTIGEDGKISDVNAATIKATGYSKDELIGTDFSNYFVESERAKEGYKKVFSEGTVRDYILQLKHRNGNIMTVAYNASVFKDEAGAVKGVFAAARDITEQRKAEIELEKYRENLENLVKIRTKELEDANKELFLAKENAEKASRSKSEFLSNMSHELRTPLNSIIGFSNILCEEEEDKEKKQILSIITESGNSLLALIQDILDMAKIEAGMMKISDETFNIDELSESIIKMFKELSQKRNNDLVAINKSEYRHLIGDEYRIKQILINLIGNANKFTENGKVLFVITSQEIDSSNVEVTFRIQDTGIGISEDKMKNLFETFNQGEHFLTKKYGGTGLGLAIVKKLTDMMGGKITVESKQGIGTTFDIAIPLKIAAKPKKENEVSVVGDKYNFSKISTLVVEDSNINVMYVEKILRDTKINIFTAEDGISAVEKFREGQFDIVLMDIQLPNMNGLEAIKRIRDIEKNRNQMMKTPIVAVSAYALKEDTEKALSAGADDYLVKPFSKIELLEIIKKWT